MGLCHLCCYISLNICKNTDILSHLLCEREKGGGIDGAHFLSLEPELKSEISKINDTHSVHTSKLNEFEKKLSGRRGASGTSNKAPSKENLRGASGRTRSVVSSAYMDLKAKKPTSDIATKDLSGGKRINEEEDLVDTKVEGDRGNGQRLHAVTYASHGGRDDRFCRAVESAIRNDFDLVILGWGVKWRVFHRNLRLLRAMQLTSIRLMYSCLRMHLTYYLQKNLR